MRGRPCRMWSPNERNGMVPWRPNDQGQMPVGQIVLCRRTVVHGTWYVYHVVCRTLCYFLPLRCWPYERANLIFFIPHDILFISTLFNASTICLSANLNDIIIRHNRWQGSGRSGVR